ncbi:MAG: hypothetical protein RL172_234 [Bacteroidota bacterium]|jgi:two-component system, NarL family, sensor kinase
MQTGGIILWAVLLYSSLHAQPPADKDSLRRLLAHTAADSTTVNNWYQYGELFETDAPDSAAWYYQKAKSLAQKIGYKKGLAAFGSHYIVLLNNKGQFKEALTIAKEALEISKTLGDKKELAVAYLNVGSEWQYLSDFALAADCYLLARQMAETINDKRLLRIANNNLASVFIELGEFEKGKLYAEQSLQIARELKNEYAISSSMYNIATAATQLKQYHKALELYKAIEKIGLQSKDDIVQLDGWLGMAEVYNAMGDAPAAEKFYQQVIRFSQQKQLPEYQMYACMGYADLLLKNKQFANARHIINTGIALAQKQGSMLELKDLYLKAAVLNEKTGSAAAALDYRKQFEVINDSILGEKSRTTIANLEAKYEFDKKEATINQLEAKNQLHTLAIQQTHVLNYILAGSAIGLLLLFALSYRNYRQKKILQQQRINELEKEKQLTATEAVLKGEAQERSRLAKDLHDGLGGLLSGIKYSFQSMKGNMVMTPENMQAFERSMDMLDSSIKEMRRVAHNLMPEALVKFGLDTALKDFCNDINQTGALQVSYQGIGLANSHIDQTTAISIYRIVQELINNTLKHASANNAIVQVSKADNKISITVEDDGRGFNTATLQQSNGMGWSNIKQRVNLLKGKLDVHSQQGEGTSVLIEFTLS